MIAYTIYNRILSLIHILQNIKANVDVTQTVLVVDAMTGQDAVNVAKTFEEKVGIDGVILTLSLIHIFGSFAGSNVETPTRRLLEFCV